MLKIFSENDEPYTFPNGSTKTVDEIKKTHEYDLLFSKTCVVNISDGVLTSYQTLANLAKSYGIDYSTDDDQDPQEVLDQVLARQQYLKENPPLTITDTVRMAASFAALTFTDEQAVQVADLYPEFELNHEYKKDERFTYNGHLFKVNQAHTSQEQWVPGEVGTESLYTNLEMAGDGYLVWTQPTGAHNAYNTGDIVHYPTKEDQLYQSLIDGNTTIPGSDERWWKVYTKE